MYNQLLVKQILLMKWDCETFLWLAGLTQWRLILSFIREHGASNLNDTTLHPCIAIRLTQMLTLQDLSFKYVA